MTVVCRRGEYHAVSISCFRWVDRGFTPKKVFGKKQANQENRDRWLTGAGLMNELSEEVVHSFWEPFLEWRLMVKHGKQVFWS